MAQVKSFLSGLLLLLTLVFADLDSLQAQVDTNWVSQPDTAELYKVTRFDGHYYVGKITRIDAREIEMVLSYRGPLVIPTYLIQSIIRVDKKQLNKEGEYAATENTLGQYVLNANAYSLGKGKLSMGGSIIGPDLTFGITDRLSARFTTTWLMTPALATIDYQIPLREKFNVKLGAMGAWGTWNLPEGGMVMPYLGITFGSREKNVTLTGGYGQLFGWTGPSPVWYSSFSFMNKVNNRWSIVFDSYLSGYEYTQQWGGWNGNRSETYTEYNGMMALAARIDNNKGGHFQFGGGMVNVDGELLPLPVLQFFQRF